MKSPAEYVAAVLPPEHQGSQTLLFAVDAERAVADAVADAARELHPAGPWTEGLERNRQQLQADYFAAKQRAEAAKAEAAGLREQLAGVVAKCEYEEVDRNDNGMVRSAWRALGRNEMRGVILALLSPAPPQPTAPRGQEGGPQDG